MTTKKVVQCAKERKLLVKEILKNQSIEIEGKTLQPFNSHRTYHAPWIGYGTVKKYLVALLFLAARLYEVIFYQKPTDL